MRATPPCAAHDLLAAFGAIPVRERVARDGRFVSGVTAGLDFALTRVAERVGRACAEAIQLGLEYAPAPPFDAAPPEIASAAVLSRAQARVAGSRAEREGSVFAITGVEVERKGWGA